MKDGNFTVYLIGFLIGLIFAAALVFHIFNHNQWWKDCVDHQMEKKEMTKVRAERICRMRQYELQMMQSGVD